MPKLFKHGNDRVSTFSSTAAMPRGKSRSISDWLLFLLPIGLIIIAVVVSYTDIRHAHPSGETDVEEKDLVEEVDGSNPLRRLVFPAMGLMGVVCWRSCDRRVKFRRPISQLALILLVILVASVLWSVEPGRTLKRVMVVCFIAVSAMGLGRTWTATDLCYAALVMSSTFISISVLAELKAGSFLQGPSYRFSGMFHPNQQGVNTGVFALSSLCLYRKKGWLVYLALAILGIGLTKLTGSRGSLLGLMFAIAATYWVTASRLKRVAGFITCGMCLSIGLILLSLSSVSLPSVNDIARMGRMDESSQEMLLNGRIPIWIECLDAAMQRPLLGYGYGAFWTSDRVAEFALIHNNWAFSSAHSAYIETVLNVGFLGAMVALALVLVTWNESLKRFRQTRDWGTMFIFSLISMGVVSGCVDVIFAQGGFVTIVLAIGIAMLLMDPTEQTQLLNVPIDRNARFFAQRRGVV